MGKSTHFSGQPPLTTCSCRGWGNLDKGDIIAIDGTYIDYSKLEELTIPLFAHIPFARNFYTTSCFYILRLV